MHSSCVSLRFQPQERPAIRLTKLRVTKDRARSVRVFGISNKRAISEVKITQDTGLIILSSPGRSAMALSIRNVHPSKESFESYLKFARYGDSWVLEEFNHDGVDQVLRRTKIEQQLARLAPAGRQTLMASNLSGH